MPLYKPKNPSHPAPQLGLTPALLNINYPPEEARLAAHATPGRRRTKPKERAADYRAARSCPRRDRDRRGARAEARERALRGRGASIQQEVTHRARTHVTQ